MGLLVKTTSFGALFVVRPTFLCIIESPKVTISRLFYKPREGPMMRDHEKLGPCSKLRTLQYRLWGL